VCHWFGESDLKDEIQEFRHIPYIPFHGRAGDPTVVDTHVLADDRFRIIPYIRCLTTKFHVGIVRVRVVEIFSGAATAGARPVDADIRYIRNIDIELETIETRRVIVIYRIIGNTPEFQLRFVVQSEFEKKAPGFLRGPR